MRKTINLNYRDRKLDPAKYLSQIFREVFSNFGDISSIKLEKIIAMSCGSDDSRKIGV